MNGPFIKISGFHGELKRSIKNGNIRISVSTEEVVFQLPHVNYYILLRDIVNLVDYQAQGHERLKLVHRGSVHHEIIRQSKHVMPLYKLYALKATAHHRSGKHTIGPLDIIMPISNDLLCDMMKYSELKPFP